MAAVEINEALIKDIEFAISEVIKSLPCLKEILHIKAPINCIYGGFLRHIAEHYLEHKRTPDTDDILSYLNKSDVDIKIKSYNVAEVLKRIYYIVYNAGGTMEYFGNDYDGTDQSFQEKFSVDDYYYEGLYSIWMPLGDTTIRYDLFISQATASGYTCDFDVNSMMFTWSLVPYPLPSPSNKRVILSVDYHYVDEYHLTAQDYVIRNIRDKKIVPYEKYLTQSMDPMKRVYRMKKLWEHGYRIDDHHKDLIIDMFDCAFKMCNEQSVEILFNRVMKAPSIPRERGLIYLTKYKPDIIDFERWFADMNDIMKECKIDLESLSLWKKRKSEDADESNDPVEC